MKRWLPILALILLSPGLRAQGSFEAGGSVALNTSWIINQNAYDVLERICTQDPLLADSRPTFRLTPGFSIGARAAYLSGSFWAAQAELNFTLAGQHYAESWQNNACERDLSDFKRKYSLIYMQLPLLVRLRTQGRGKLRGYGEAGPQLGILIGARDKVTLSGSEPGDAGLIPAKDKVKRVDFGFVLGGGTEIELSRSLYISAGLRTYFGFMDLNQSGSEAFVSTQGVDYRKSRNFTVGAQVGVHYVFDWIGGMYR